MKWIFTPLALVILAGLAYAIVVMFRPVELPDGILYANGHIEGTEVRVSAEIPGRVVSTNMDEGEVVERGSVLATLDDADIQKQLEQAQAEAEAVEQQRNRTERELETLRHHLSTAEADLERNRQLRAEDVVPETRLEAAEDRYEEVQGKVVALQSTQAQLAAQIESAQRIVELFQLQLEKTTVEAPLTATVLVQAVEEGEYVNPGQPLAVLVDLSEMELRVFVPESSIGKIKLGDPARVRVDAFPNRYFDARVSQIDAEAQFTPKDIHVPEDRTRMVFGVKLALDNPERLLKPGMPADAWIRWSSDASWSETLNVPMR